MKWVIFLFEVFNVWMCSVSFCIFLLLNIFNIYKVGNVSFFLCILFLVGLFILLEE